MRTVTELEARNSFHDLLAEVEGGVEIVITRAGAPVARLVRADAGECRTLGLNDGRGWIADDFDECIPERFG